MITILVTSVRSISAENLKYLQDSINSKSFLHPDTLWNEISSIFEQSNNRKLRYEKYSRQ